MKPRVAMLSFQQQAAQKHPNVAMVQQAVEIIHARALQLQADGELQFDAAFVPVSLRKSPEQ